MTFIQDGGYPRWRISKMVDIQYDIYPKWRISKMADIQDGACPVCVPCSPRLGRWLPRVGGGAGRPAAAPPRTSAQGQTAPGPRRCSTEAISQSNTIYTSNLKC